MCNITIFGKNASCSLVAALAAMAIGATACGDDGAVSGPQAITGGDTTGGGDGSLSGSDAATLSDGTAIDQDTAIGADGAPLFVCGNGICEGPTETPQTCPADCHSVVGGPDATTGGNPVCGNGICEAPSETMLLCPADCKTPASPAETCKHQACGPQYDACEADAACVASIKCFNAGGGNECVTSAQVGQEVQALTQCINGSGCPGTTGGGGGGGGGGTGATCGNGTCDQGETMLTCPKDCTQPQSATEACYHQACPTQYAACSADPACVKSVDCFNTGGTPQQCGNNANQSALDQCVTNSGCNTQGGGGGGLKNCGNGVCDPDETELTCPADCKTAVNPQETCLQTSCPSQYKSCQADKACVTVVDCLVNNQNNPQQCMGGGMTPAVQGLFQCAQQANCLGGGGGGGGGGGTAQTTCQGACGNYSNVAGSCQCDNQCTANGDCCKDYSSLCGTGPATVCGDGTCTAPQETAANCPADCAAPPPTPCKTKNDCATTEVCCGLASGSVCTPIGQCN